MYVPTYFKCSNVQKFQRTSNVLLVQMECYNFKNKLKLLFGVCRYLYSVDIQSEKLIKICVLESGKTIMCIDPQFYRPAEVNLLIGNPEKALRELNWKPKVTVKKLCKMMVDTDLERIKTGVSF